MASGLLLLLISMINRRTCYKVIQAACPSCSANYTYKKELSFEKVLACTLALNPS